MANVKIVFRLRDFFVLFCLGVAIYWMLIPRLGHPGYTWAVSDAREAHSWATFRFRMCQYVGVEVTDDEFNLWLAHHLPKEHVASQTLVDPPEFDIWTNPYKIQRRANPRDPPLVYSVGEDGISKSDGMDADDIRAWESNPGKWYSQRESWRNALSLFCCSGIYICFAIVGYFAIVFLENSTTTIVDGSNT